MLQGQKDGLKFKRPTGSVSWVAESLYCPAALQCEEEKASTKGDTEASSTETASSGSEEDLAELSLEVETVGKREVVLSVTFDHQRKIRTSADTVSQTLFELAKFKEDTKRELLSSLPENEVAVRIEEEVKTYLRENDIDLQWLRENFIMQVN
jgi:hypothetical protein